MELNSLEDINKVLDFNFKNSLKLSTLEVSCPECQKLYAINPHEIMSTKPQFNCRQCETSFHINYPDCLENTEIIGIKNVCKASKKALDSEKNSVLEAQLPSSFEPQEVVPEPSIAVKSSVETKNEKINSQTHVPVINCPKCNYINVATSVECIKCSVIIAKVNIDKDHEPAIYASRELKDLWELVLDNYDSVASHQNFIRYSGLEQNLEYASQKYNMILSVNPHDDIANNMKTQIHSLAAVEVRRSAAVVPARNIFRFLNLWTFSFILSFSIIGLGLYFDQYKNLIGIGAFSLSLIAGLKFLQSRYK